MKFSSLLITSTISAILTISFTGCGANTPHPYNVKVQNYSNITNNEKDTLFSYNINSIKKFRPDKRGRYSSPSILTNNTISYFGLNATFAHRFDINHNLNKIYRTDISKATHGNNRGKEAYGSFTDDFGFTNYINFFQTKLTKNFNNSLAKYSEFKTSYDKHKKNANIKKMQIHTIFNDLSKKLPKLILEKLSKNIITISNSNSAIQLFLNNKQSNIFVITSNATQNTIDRYKVNYKKTRYSNNYDKFPINITYEIDKVYYNYLPESLIIKDNNIDVEIKNNPLGVYGSIKYIKIYNKTKEFIEIDTIAGYYDKNVTDNIINTKNKRVKIPPMSYKIFKPGYGYKYRINDFPNKKVLFIKDKNQVINYGFSIGYKMINQNIIKNLYKVNNYSIKDFK